MSLRYGILGLLRYGDMSGYEVNKVFNDSLAFFWPAQTSQIYRELNTMENKGWLFSTQVIQSDKPNKRIYSLTDLGKNEFDLWLSNADKDTEEAMKAKSAYLLRVFFAGELSKQEAKNLLLHYKDVCETYLQDINSTKQIIENYQNVSLGDNRTKFWLITALYGKMHYLNGIKWAEESLALLEEEK